MNTIQKALAMQDITAGWNGPEPESPKKISKAYLTELIEGFPRIVRSLGDAGNEVKIGQLKTDYKELLRIK